MTGLIKKLKKDGILVATKNKGKLEEISEYFNPYNIKLKSLLDLDYKIEINEDGDTFKENSLKKAVSVILHENTPVLADDSGLVVPALNDEPGIHSARYSGIGASDDDNMNKLLSKIKHSGLIKPKAYFYCSMTLLVPSYGIIEADGRLDGLINDIRRGNKGFGYDPIFYLQEKQFTLAELSLETKNTISHRARALENLIKKIGLKQK